VREVGFEPVNEVKYFFKTLSSSQFF